ncbi:MAG: hypothetical protein HYU64_15430 [Armatimonadetes bacterium]|nr:hypothetical protein [Armatimonadota bacterium]
MRSTCALIFLLFLIPGLCIVFQGCKKAPEKSPGPAQHQTGAPPPGISHDPAATRSSEGEIQEVKSSEIIVKVKGMGLRFAISPKTEIVPKGTRLAVGQKVRIQITYKENGMAAEKVEIK